MIDDCTFEITKITFDGGGSNSGGERFRKHPCQRAETATTVDWTVRATSKLRDGTIVTTIGSGTFVADKQVRIGPGEGAARGKLVLSFHNAQHPTQDDVWHIRLRAPGNYFGHGFKVVAEIVDSTNSERRRACLADSYGTFLANTDTPHGPVLQLTSICGRTLILWHAQVRLHER